MQDEISQLKLENARLNTQANQMAIPGCLNYEEEQESMNLNSRRDCLEFHGIPEMPNKNKDDLIKQILDLIAVEVKPSEPLTCKTLFRHQLIILLREFCLCNVDIEILCDMIPNYE